MNPNSAAGPDGMNGKFFQSCWDIIKIDLLAVVQSFFCGHTMPKCFSRTRLVLLPKVDHPNKLTEFRPISLSNFTNKIISKLICSRFATVLPGITSINQTGFVRGRSITENIMLAQEIIHGIKKPNHGDNVVIKLDMAKAYDRVSWSFTCLVLRRMGFCETIIDMVWRIMANNWYSVIVNGTRHGFFHSTRGLKQGDPLAPALFILGAEVLSRMMNKLFHNHSFHGFYMEKRGPQINHLSFADDVIVFSSGKKKSLQLIMKTLSKYEQVSGQLINRDKSHFMVHPETSQFTIARINKVTGFNQEGTPITYLGCPLYVGRQRILYFSNMVAKVVSRIRGWQSKILSYGGRATLVRYVLQSLPIHLLSAVSPPKTTLKQIQSITADFFWGWKNERKKYHWSSWKNLSYPYEEGGIGVRQITDVCKSLQFKQWWIFRSKTTLWGNFLRAKYCQRANPIIKKWDTGQSLIWKNMMHNKLIAESYIQWRVNSGTCSFWWDDWLGIGPLANYRLESNRANNITVSQFLIEGQWNIDMINQIAPPQLVQTILTTQIDYNEHIPDQAIWKLTSGGEFTCSTAWNLVRQSKAKNLINSLIWQKNIPFKCSFHLWRTLRGKLPTDEKIITFGHDPSDCHCCHDPGPDSIEHIHVAGHFARNIWQYFSPSLGIRHQTQPLRSLLLHWWKQKYRNEAQKLWPPTWRNLISLMEVCTHEINITKVNWSRPQLGVLKINTDGSALDNPGRIGAGGIVRNDLGNLIFAFATPLGYGTNNQAEIEAAYLGLKWAKENGQHHIVLEVDSELLIRWIKQQAKPPWNLFQSILKLSINCGQWLDNAEDIAEEAVGFFQAQFHETVVPTQFDILKHVPSMISNEQNEELVAAPTKEEVKQAVFGLNSTSAGGPDGFTGLFFQTCQDIVGDEHLQYASGQLINKNKSSVYLHDRVDEEEFRKLYYEGEKRAPGMERKLLSFGGRAILLKHVLQAMPMHLISAVDPPSFVIEKLHKIFAGVLLG
ncbi:uncharacterized protein LOC132043044 [Lycium ferocissimum]|uniref:uncharacterized protein LOC132043044 n=1 Tax=Lycium ferocissimum TaxID=112874 RepID=UPI0028163A5B|nr:uncharacterized protein LOC132043044 [Lycium ferocissimum]